MLIRKDWTGFKEERGYSRERQSKKNKRQMTEFWALGCMVRKKSLSPGANMQYLPCSSVKSESGGWILVTVVMVTVVMVTVVMVIVGVGVSRGRHTVSVISHQAFVQA